MSIWLWVIVILIAVALVIFWMKSKGGKEEASEEKADMSDMSEMSNSEPETQPGESLSESTGMEEEEKTDAGPTGAEEERTPQGEESSEEEKPMQ